MSIKLTNRTTARRIGSSAAAAAVLAVGLTIASATSATGDPVVYIHPGPIFEGQLPFVFEELEIESDLAIAGDPSIIKDGEDAYRMYYACYGVVEEGTEVCLAESEDGIVWEDADIGSLETFNKGQVLFGQAEGANWDNAHETPFAIEDDGVTYLYYVGYEDPGAGFFGNDEVPIGMAWSADGINFTEITTPILTPTANGLDDHGMTSPSVTVIGGAKYMMYTGWCLENETVCPRLADDLHTATLMATNFSEIFDPPGDWYSWGKVSGNRTPDEGLPEYAPNGIAETHLLKGPGTNEWVLLFTALGPDGPVGIGVATQSSYAFPVGTWTYADELLVSIADLDQEDGWIAEETKPLAPHGLIEDGTLRIWFAGESEVGYRIGYAETDWPLT